MTREAELRALQAVNLQAFISRSDVWSDDLVHIDEINRDVFDEVMGLFARMRLDGRTRNPVIQGQRGSGKSHLLGCLRREIIGYDHLFILVEMDAADRFWEVIVQSYLASLFRSTGDNPSQFESLIKALLAKLDIPEGHRDAMLNGDFFEVVIRRVRTAIHRQVGRGTTDRVTSDIGLALLLHLSNDDVAVSVAANLLRGATFPANTGRAYGLRSDYIAPRETLRALHRLFTFAGKMTLVAFDQMDWLHSLPGANSGDGAQNGLNEFANALMEFADDCADQSISVLPIVSCLPTTWDLIETRALSPAQDRFPSRYSLRFLPSAQAGEKLVGAYLKTAYDQVDFRPSYPTWPFLPEAFARAPQLTTRQLINLTNEHIRRMRQAGQITEVSDLAEGDRSPPDPGTESAQPEMPPGPVGPDPQQATELDKRFAAYRKRATVPDVSDPKMLDLALTPLIQAGLQAFSIETDTAECRPDSLPTSLKNPDLHGRLRQEIDPETEREIHWCFRSIEQDHARSVQTRLRGARTRANVGPMRHLIVMRNADWPRGAVSQRVLAEFREEGGQLVPLLEEDLRTFAALQQLFAEQPLGLDGWLRARRPASQTALLKLIKLEGAVHQPADPKAENTSGGKQKSVAAENKAVGGEPPVDRTDVHVPEDHILLGKSMVTGVGVTLPIEDLRRHMVIFAGSGSGKTVLIRRIVEECARKGVSSIVLDPNNDLARLGSAVQEAPSGWWEGDAERAEAYHRDTDVAVWTPRLPSGRALSFAPLPDLSPLLGNQEELALALDNIVSVLAPRSGLPVGGRKKELGRAVLKETLRSFVLVGGKDLRTYIDYLMDLPEGVSQLPQAGTLAPEMGECLLAATVNDPLFGGEGSATDPGLLLTPPEGKKARISVISMAGLPNLDQQQNFVAQLQMDLFAWFKRHPAGDKHLGGLLIMDEAQNFAPGVGTTPSTDSTTMLAAQARKFGLGLIFATQAPKGLHNRIPGNATTQFFGRLTVPVQMEAARDMASAKGGTISDIGQMKVGQFYVASERIDFQKIQTPMCLSHHPKSACTQEEVVELAMTSRLASEAREKENAAKAAAL